MKPGNFFVELKRRNVYKVAVAYAIVGWLIAQIATQIFPFLEIPNWVIRLVIALVVIGFPIALVIAWAFEATPEGIKRTEVADTMPTAAGQKKHVWIYVVVIGAGISVALFFLGRYTAENRTPRQSEAATVPQKSIAVLPFVNMSADKNDEYLSDGVSEELITALSKITGLQVKARTSSFAFKGKNEDIQKIGELLHVSHLLEGSVAKAGNKLRITAQLIQASDGNHLWSDTYDRDMQDIFAVRSEVAELRGETPPRSFTKSGRAIDMRTASVPELIEAGILFCGTPDRVYAQLVEFCDYCGGMGNLLMMGHAGPMSHADTVDNLTLFAKEVLPRLTQHKEPAAATTATAA